MTFLQFGTPMTLEHAYVVLGHVFPRGAVDLEGVESGGLRFGIWSVLGWSYQSFVVPQDRLVSALSVPLEGLPMLLASSDGLCGEDRVRREIWLARLEGRL